MVAEIQGKRRRGVMKRDSIVRIGLGVVSGLGVAAAAFLLLGPDLALPPTIPFQDKVLHVLAFACLVVPGVIVMPRPYVWFWVTHFVALGAGIEVAQAMGDQGRVGDVFDFLGDCVGIGVAIAVGQWIRPRVIIHGLTPKPQPGAG